MLVVGLTGGIGVGKSTVANLFAQLNVPIIDADVIAHHLTMQPTYAQAIAEHFPQHTLLNNKQLNRQLLREIIFNDSQAREWLENLLHPLIKAEILRQIQACTNAPYVIVVIPLLVETLTTLETTSFVNRVLVVDAQIPTQIARTVLRDNISIKAAEKIVAAQSQRQVRLSHADDILLNDGSLAELSLQVQKLHEKYLTIQPAK